MPTPLLVLLAFLFVGPPNDALAAGSVHGLAPGAELALTVSARGLPTVASGPVREALREGEYPWYDPDADQVRPVWPARLSWLKWLGDRLDRFLRAIGRFFNRLGFGSMSAGGIRSDWVAMYLVVTALTTFFVTLAVLWFRREPGLASGAKDRLLGPGSGALLASLPEGLRSGLDDPWAEALRRREAGDLAGAVVYLFAHQLITLDQMGLIRLAPGWTGRHYVRWLKDPVLVDSLRATLGLFEEVYYGRRLPSPDAFESVWSRAMAFQTRQGALGAAR
jgi:hypothetical protein